MKVEDVLAKSVADPEYFSVFPEDEVRRVLSKIRGENIFACPVMEDGKLEGMITWRRILQRSVPPQTKVRKLISRVPKVEGDRNLVEVADLMLETGSRAVPVFEDDELVGLLTQHDIIRAVSKDENFRGKKIEDLFSQLVTIKERQTIGKAKALMRENRVARLPVVGGEGKLVGSVDLSGIVKSFNVEKAMQVGERKGDTTPERDSPVTTIMNRKPLTVEQDSNLKGTAKKIAQDGGLYAIAVDGDKPVGIVTPKDIIEIVASRKEEKEAYIQIAGAKNLDSFDKSKILDLGERTVKKAARIFRDVENLIIHLKKQNAEGGRTQYSVRTRLFTSKGLFIAKHGWEWGVLDAVEECLNKLERRFTKQHEKKIDSRRGKGP